MTASGQTGTAASGEAAVTGVRPDRSTAGREDVGPASGESGTAESGEAALTGERSDGLTAGGEDVGTGRRRYGTAAARQDGGTPECNGGGTAGGNGLVAAGSGTGVPSCRNDGKTAGGGDGGTDAAAAPRLRLRLFGIVVATLLGQLVSAALCLALAASMGSGVPSPLFAGGLWPLLGGLPALPGLLGRLR